MREPLSKKRVVLLIVLMCVIGTCMHFVCDVVPEGLFQKILGNVFPVNETSWEHMKMIWFPFLVAGIVMCLKYRELGFIGSFVIAGIAAMPIQLGIFSFYQSFTGSSVLILDIIFYMADMILLALLALLLSTRDWVENTWILWIVVAIIVTAGIVFLTYHPGAGYVFLDDTQLK